MAKQRFTLYSVEWANPKGRIMHSSILTDSTENRALCIFLCTILSCVVSRRATTAGHQQQLELQSMMAWLILD